VRSFYTAIHASMTGSGVEEIQNGVFKIDSPEIVEAEVIISSKDSISSINVLDPDGNAMQESQTFSVTGTDSYKVIKIVSPALGKYTVQAVTDDPTALKEMLIKKYAVEIKATTTLYNNDSSYDPAITTPYVGKVQVTPVYKGEPYVKDSFINSVTECSYFVDDGEKENLVFDSDTQAFVGYFPIIGAGDYTVTATMSTPNMNRTAVCILEADTPIKHLDNGGYTFDLGEITVKRGGKKVIDIVEQYPTLSLILSEVELRNSGKPCANAEATGTTQITLTGKKTGDAALIGKASDGAGNPWEITGTVKVVFGLFLYEIILIILGLLLCVGLIFVLLNKLDHADGHFSIKIENTATGAYEEYDLSGYPKGKKFSLWSLVETVINKVQSRGNLSYNEKGLV
jgi:hypothetical protein